MLGIRIHGGNWDEALGSSLAQLWLSGMNQRGWWAGGWWAGLSHPPQLPSKVAESHSVYFLPAPPPLPQGFIVFTEFLVCQPSCPACPLEPVCPQQQWELVTGVGLLLLPAPAGLSRGSLCAGGSRWGEGAKESMDKVISLESQEVLPNPGDPRTPGVSERPKWESRPKVRQS